jgi:16S rRNA (cytidine1402-2'-O)-methyltransferase
VENDTRDSIARRGVGTLFVVATPIGNLADLSPRAASVLLEADLLLAEDTRHTGQLLRAANVQRRTGRVEPLHEHNERDRVPAIVDRLLAGESVALVSDAGTPLLSDPGMLLVAEAARCGCDVVAVPGPSSIVAALSVAGLPTERFVFEGFLPTRRAARRRVLKALADEPRTLVFFEAPHRIVASLADIADCLGENRPTVVARELTKKFETIYRGRAGDLAARALAEEDIARGELVVLVGGASEKATDDADAARVLEILSDELPASQAARLAARITGRSRRELYALNLGDTRKPSVATE